MIPVNSIANANALVGVPMMTRTLTPHRGHEDRIDPVCSINRVYRVYVG